MIITRYKTISVEVGSGQFGLTFTCDSRAPGLVVLRSKDGTVNLPGNSEDADRLIAAYRAVVSEDVGYKTTEVPDPAKLAAVLPLK